MVARVIGRSSAALGGSFDDVVNGAVGQSGADNGFSFPEFEFRLYLLESFSFGFGHEKARENGRHGGHGGKGPKGRGLAHVFEHGGKDFGNGENQGPVDHDGDAAGDAFSFRWIEFADYRERNGAVAEAEDNVEHCEAGQGQPADGGYVVSLSFNMKIIAQNSEAESHGASGKDQQRFPAKTIDHGSDDDRHDDLDDTDYYRGDVRLDGTSGVLENGYGVKEYGVDAGHLLKPHEPDAGDESFSTGSRARQVPQSSSSRLQTIRFDSQNADLRRGLVRLSAESLERAGGVREAAAMHQPHRAFRQEMNKREEGYQREATCYVENCVIGVRPGHVNKYNAEGE